MDPLLRLDGLELPSDDATVVSHHPFPGRPDWARLMHANQARALARDVAGSLAHRPSCVSRLATKTYVSSSLKKIHFLVG